MDNDLNEFLERICERCDNGVHKCPNSEQEYHQSTTTYDEPDYEECIDDLNNWDQ